MADGIEVGHAFVSISADARPAVKQVRRDFDRDMPGVGKRAGEHLGGGIFDAAKRFAGPLAAAFAVDKVTGFLKDSIGAASDLNEAGTKTVAIFGKDGSKALDDFAKGSAQKLGQTKLQILDAAGTFGTFGKAAGLGGKDLVKFSTGFNTLSTDLASFFNVDPKQAMEDIAAGLRGEAEPLRKYGILLDDASLRTEALKQGLIKTTKQALTPQQKVLAAQALIYRQTKDAQGDFARTSGGLANQQRILAAQIGEVKTRLGSAFLPIAVKVVTFLNNRLGPAVDFVAKMFSKAHDSTTPLGSVLKTLSLSVRAFFAAFREGDVTSDGFVGFAERLGVVFKTVFATIRPVVDALGNSFKTNLGQAVPLVKGIGAALVEAGPTIRTVFSTLGDVLVKYVIPGITLLRGIVISFATAALPVIVAGFRQLATFIATQVVPRFIGIVGAVRQMIAVVLPIIKQVVAAFLKEWPKIQPIVSTIFKTIGGIITDVMDFIRDDIKKVTAVIQYIWSRWGNQITAFASGKFREIFGIISGVMKVIGGIIKVVTGVMTGDWRKAGEGIKQIVDGLKTALAAKFGDIAKKIRDNVSTLMTKVRDKFRDGVTAIGKAWDGLMELAKKPIRFVVNTVINDGLIGAFNKIAAIIPGVSKLPNVSVGFRTGGYTGQIDPNKVAGVVHGREYVFDAPTVEKAGGPGVLDAWRTAIQRGSLSKPGDVGMPGYKAGGFVKALDYAKANEGHPYIFGSLWDCSGFISALQSIIYGESPHRRWATPAFAGGPQHAQGFTRNRQSAFMIGVNPSPGKFGHTAGTLLGHNVEEAGGVGLRVGGSARGWNDSMFPLHYGLDEGGGGIFAALKAGFSSLADWFKDLIKAPLAKLSDLASSPLGQLAAGVPRLAVEGLVSKIKGYAGGTSSTTPGWAMVGERGPELVRFSGGQQVLSNAQTRGMGGLTINGGVHGFTAAEVAEQIERKRRQREALNPVFAA